MKIFDLPVMLQSIQEDIQLGLTPDPSSVNMLLEQGPVVIEEWVDAIEVIDAEAEFIKDRIDQLKKRMESRKKSAERMRQALCGVLLQAFDGKVKSPLITVWVVQKDGKEPSLHVRR